MSAPVARTLSGSIALTVAAVPTGPESRLERGLELFNLSQFPRTIAGLSRSLGDPKVAAVNAVEGTAVDIWVGRVLSDEPAAFDPLGLPPTDTTDDAAAQMGLDLGATPSFAQVEALQAQLALALERGGLGVEATDEDQVAVEPAQLLVGQRVDDGVVVGVRDTLPLGVEQLDHLRAAVLDGAFGGLGA